MSSTSHVDKANNTLLILGDFYPDHRDKKAIKAGTYSGVLDQELQKKMQNSFTIVNLEYPVCSSSLKPEPKTGPNLRGGNEGLDFLKWAQVDLLTLANNHILDFGQQGLKETLENCAVRGLDTVGAGTSVEEAERTYYTQIAGKKVAIVNLAENEWTTLPDGSGAHALDPISNFRRIQEAKGNADIVVLITHGGHEHYELPSPRMKNLFHGFIDFGADAVINHHPHIISGMENYKGKPIAYSIGNFMFDNPAYRNKGWNKGMGAVLTIKKEEICLEPVFFNQANENAGASCMKAEEEKNIKQHVETLSAIISDDSQLHKRFQVYCAQEYRQYASYLEPISNRYLNFLRRRGWFPTSLNSKRNRILTNIIRNESHKDVVLETLRKWK